MKVLPSLGATAFVLSGLLAALIAASGEASALPGAFKEYAGKEHDGTWKGTGVTTGPCRPMLVSVKISGSRVEGNAWWEADAKRAHAASTVVGVIHGDGSVQAKLKRSQGNGRTSIARGAIDIFELSLRDETGACPYEIRLSREG